MPKKVILDTSFLMVSLEKGLDLLGELEKILSVKVEPVILPPVVEELERLASKGKPKVGRTASFALKLAEKYVKVNVERRPGEPVDDYLARVAGEMKLPVATVDLKLKRELRRRGIPIAYLRGRRLELEGWWD